MALIANVYTVIVGLNPDGATHTTNKLVQLWFSSVSCCRWKLPLKCCIQSLIGFAGKTAALARLFDAWVSIMVFKNRSSIFAIPFCQRHCKEKQQRIKMSSIQHQIICTAQELLNNFVFAIYYQIQLNLIFVFAECQNYVGGFYFLNFLWVVSNLAVHIVHGFLSLW